MAPNAQPKSDSAKAAWPCPACGYPLIGLPAVHRCPECGIEYDPHARVFRLHYRRRRPILLLATTAVIWGAIAVLGLTCWRQEDLGSRIVFQMIAGMPLALATILVWPFEKAQPGRLLLNLRGVHVELPEPYRKDIPWTTIGSAKYSWVAGRLYVRDKAGVKLARLNITFFDSAWAARRCADAINQLLRVYGADEAKAQT